MVMAACHRFVLQRPYPGFDRLIWTASPLHRV
ncbi:hypothetical protein ABIA03_001078 [Bradyrhizobium yuanmingense]|uniref:Uncharacterized protein n=1 Tax=Bradyrhizobium yuanmingense TaxID=108015 RepID=A0ABV4GPA4_9BRAD